ncbi:MAG TPA: diacylglycerol kinase family protein [Acidimicrobiales bacterium]
MRILLIVNPRASSVTPKLEAIVEKALSEKHEVVAARTSHRGHATELAREAVAERMDAVVVFGGDGTLNEAANGLIGTDVALAILPGGSTNVFARTIGMTNDAVSAVDVLLDALARSAIEPIGIGTANGRAFLFHAGLGYDAAIVAEVERHQSLKRLAGQALFAFAAVDTWLRHYDRDRPHFAVHLPDGTTIENGYYTIVLNTDPYTFLGSRPFRIAPEAGLGSPLAAITVQSLALWPLTQVAAAALTNSEKVRSHPSVDYRADLAELRIVGYRPFPYQLDGDHLGDVNEVTFRHIPDAIRMVKP